MLFTYYYVNSIEKEVKNKCTLRQHFQGAQQIVWFSLHAFLITGKKRTHSKVLNKVFL